MRLFVGTLGVLSLIFYLSLMLAPSVSASSLWPKDGVFSVGETTPFRVDRAQICQYTDYKVMKLPTKPLQDRNGCVIETGYGEVAEGRYVKRYIGNFTEVYAHSSMRILPVPGTQKLFLKGCGSNGCVISYYDNFAEGMSLTRGFEYQYRFNDTIERNAIKDPLTGANVTVRASQSSKNGDWMVLEVSNWFVRYNVETGEVLRFARGSGSYGSGQNPSYEFSITNDGRYVVISGINVNYTYVYDLSTCTGYDSTNPYTSVASCERVDVGQAVIDAYPDTRTVTQAAFQSGGREIVGMANRGGGVATPFIVRSDSVLSRADYIGFGDSFSSGEGDSRSNEYYMSGTDGSSEYPQEKCHLSLRSYPYLLSGVGDETLMRNVACSGSVVYDVTASASRYPGHFKQLSETSSSDKSGIFKNALNSGIPGRAPQYMFAEQYQPKDMTITIGGNDAGFGSVLEQCVTLGTCGVAEQGNERYGKAREMRDKFSTLRKTYRQLMDVNPDGKLYVLSYPQFIDEDASCAVNVRFNATEREFIRQSVDYFNDVIRQAALAEGAEYIDITDALEGKALCSGYVARAVNGVTWGDDFDLWKFKRIIASESYHPNPLGHQMIANYITTHYGRPGAMNGESCPAESCSSYTAPVIPAYFGADNGSPRKINQVLLNSFNIVFKRLSPLSMRFTANSVAGATGKLTLHSDPIDLGTVTADSQGIFTANITIPADLEPGYHEIQLETQAVDGSTVNYYQPITVIASEEDIDGDGLPNELDKCQFIAPANEDYDQDGVDDGCDKDITELPAEPDDSGGGEEGPGAGEDADGANGSGSSSSSTSTTNTIIAQQAAIGALSPATNPLLANASINNEWWMSDNENTQSDTAKQDVLGAKSVVPAADTFSSTASGKIASGKSKPLIYVIAAAAGVLLVLFSAYRVARARSNNSL